MNVAKLPRSSSATHFRWIVPPVQGIALFVSVKVTVRRRSSDSQLSLTSTSATGKFPVQLTVKLGGKDNGSKTGGRISINAMVKPKSALLP